MLRYFVSSLVVDYTSFRLFPARLIIAGLGPVRPSVCLAFSRGKKKINKNSRKQARQIPYY